MRITALAMGFGSVIAGLACSSSPLPTGHDVAPPANDPIAAPEPAAAHALVYFEGTVDIARGTMNIVRRSPEGQIQAQDTLPYGTAPGDVYFHTCASPAVTYTMNGTGGVLAGLVQAVNDMSGAIPDLAVKIDSISDTGTTFAATPGSLYGSVGNTGAKDCQANTATWTFTQVTTTNFTFVGEADGTAPSASPPCNTEALMPGCNTGTCDASDNVTCTSCDPGYTLEGTACVNDQGGC